MLCVMLLMTNRKLSPASVTSTPYRDLLCGLAAVGDHDAEIAQFLMSMAACIDAGRYGTLKLLYRLLPMRDRQALGYPPASREEDEIAAK